MFGGGFGSVQDEHGQPPNLLDMYIFIYTYTAYLGTCISHALDVMYHVSLHVRSKHIDTTCMSIYSNICNLM